MRCTVPAALYAPVRARSTVCIASIFNTVADLTAPLSTFTPPALLFFWCLAPPLPITLPDLSFFWGGGKLKFPYAMCFRQNPSLADGSYVTSALPPSCHTKHNKSELLVPPQRERHFHRFIKGCNTTSHDYRVQCCPLVREFLLSCITFTDKDTRN